MLCLYGEPQWAVVGDTFPVGCRYSERIVYHEFFAETRTPSTRATTRSSACTREGCGLRNVLMSWGHDEYLYHVMKNYLPEPALYMIRYHSFYAWHREGEYDWLMRRPRPRRCCRGCRSSIRTICIRSRRTRRTGLSCGRTTQNLVAKYLPANVAF